MKTKLDMTNLLKAFSEVAISRTNNGELAGMSYLIFQRFLIICPGNVSINLKHTVLGIMYLCLRPY